MPKIKSRRLWTAVFIAFLLPWANGYANISQTQVSYSVTDDGLFVVDTFVDGQGPYPFLIDTGASTSVLTDHLHASLNNSSGTDQTTRIHGVAESAVFPSVTLQSIKVGEHEIRPVQVSVMPSVQEGKEWDGILSMDFFEDRIVLFESGTKTITVMPATDATRARFAKWRKLNAYRDESLSDFPFIFFKTEFVTNRGFRGRPMMEEDRIEAMLDLGSSVPIINWAGARKLGYGQTYRQLEKDWRVEGAVGAFEPKALIPEQNILVARKTWTTPVLIYDTAPLSLIDRADEPFMYFSANFFDSMDFAIDFTEPEVYLSP